MKDFFIAKYGTFSGKFFSKNFFDGYPKKDIKIKDKPKILIDVNTLLDLSSVYIPSFYVYIYFLNMVDQKWIFVEKGKNFFLIILVHQLLYILHDGMYKIKQCKN